MLTPAFNTLNFWCFKPWWMEGFHLSLWGLWLCGDRQQEGAESSSAPGSLHGLSPNSIFHTLPPALRMTRHKKNRVRITMAIKLVKKIRRRQFKKLFITAGLFCYSWAVPDRMWEKGFVGRSKGLTTFRKKNIYIYLSLGAALQLQSIFSLLKGFTFELKGI